MYIYRNVLHELFKKYFRSFFFRFEHFAELVRYWDTRMNPIINLRNIPST